MSLTNKLKNIVANYRTYGNKLYVPLGHYYSPIVSPEEMEKRKDEIWKAPVNSIPGIDLRESEQLKLLESFKSYYAKLPFEAEAKEGLRYQYANSMYSYSDGIMLFSMMMHFKPKRIIEVGSGYSSALMLDTNHNFFDSSIQCTFIEPYPERLNSLLKPNEKISLRQQPVQDIDLSLFEALEENDFLFIDSTHVSKTGSDVNFIFFEILPKLKKGVKIHFHDIFYPFEYPKQWVITEGRNWNEDYILRAFLSYNSEFRIIMFNTYLEHFHEKWFAENMPLCLKNRGGSIWIEKQ
jgi:predicted O-methyltransferase YrrM